MTETEQASGSARLTAQIKIAYWIALGLIGLMATASYVLLDRKLSDHQLDRRLLSFVSSQSALSQRMVFLANEAGATTRADRPAMLGSLKAATRQFETNYDLLLKISGVETENSTSADRAMIEEVLFGAPHHLDHFTAELASRTRRYIAAAEAELAPGVGASSYSAAEELRHLDETVATSTLRGYSELREPDFAPGT